MLTSCGRVVNIVKSLFLLYIKEIICQNEHTNQNVVKESVHMGF